MKHLITANVEGGGSTEVHSSLHSSHHLDSKQKHVGTEQRPWKASQNATSANTVCTVPPAMRSAPSPTILREGGGAMLERSRGFNLSQPNSVARPAKAWQSAPWQQGQGPRGERLPNRSALLHTAMDGQVETTCHRACLKGCQALVLEGGQSPTHLSLRVHKDY